jgi:hypothetical protein
MILLKGGMLCSISAPLQAMLDCSSANKTSCGLSPDICDSSFDKESLGYLWHFPRDAEGNGDQTLVVGKWIGQDKT